MQIIFAGTPNVAVLALEQLVDSGVNVVGVMTRPPARKGRSKKLIESPVAAFAQSLGLPLLETSTPGSPEALAWLEALAPDLGVVVAYGAILKPDVLAIPKEGWVNLHFSALPDLRGPAPVQRALLRGDQSVGTTVFQLDSGVDTGPIVSVRSHDVGAGDTSDQVLEQLAVAGGAQLVEAVTGIAAGTAVFSEQSEKGSHAPKLFRQDGYVSFEEPVVATVNRVRAVTSNPGAWTKDFQGLGLKLAGVTPAKAQLAPGQTGLLDGALVVGCPDGAVRVERVAPAGKTWMSAADWLRGARPAQTDRLGGLDGDQP